MMLEPKSLLRNFWLKFFSITLATVIWLGIHYGIRNQLSIQQLNINNVSVPIAVVQQPGDTRVFKTTPAEATVFAVGKTEALHKGIRVYVDLTDFRSTHSTGEILRAEAPPEINIISISPETVTVDQVK